MPVIEGTTRTLHMVGAPVNGTDAVFTVSIGATVTGGNLGYFTFDGYQSSVIAWSNSNTTLVAATQAALDAMPPIGTGGAVVSAGTMTLGVNGTMLVTFSGARLAKTAVPVLTLAGVALTGGSTAASSYSTSGVTASFRNAGLGSLLCDNSANGKLYKNTGSAIGAPTWTAQT